MAAEQCVPLSEKKVIVIPTKTVPEGIAAMLAVDPDAEEDVNTSEMTQAMAQVKTIQITYAARDSVFDGFSISEKDYLALVNDALFGTNQDLKALFQQLTESLQNDNPQYITIYYGEDVSEADAEMALKDFQAACPDVEINLLNGGQPVYYYIISVE